MKHHIVISYALCVLALSASNQSTAYASAKGQQKNFAQVFVQRKPGGGLHGPFAKQLKMLEEGLNKSTGDKNKLLRIVTQENQIDVTYKNQRNEEDTKNFEASEFNKAIYYAPKSAEAGTLNLNNAAETLYHLIPIDTEVLIGTPSTKSTNRPDFSSAPTK